MRFLGRSLTGLFLLATTIGILALALSMVQAAFKTRAERDRTPAPVRERVFAANVTTIRAQTLTPVLTTFGELSARRALDIRPLTGGSIVQIGPNFVTGGRVARGDLLLRIDPTDFERALALAQTDLTQARAELRDAKAALELAQDDLKSATRQSELREGALARQKDLVARKIGTEAALETASLAASSARQAVLAKRQSVISAQARVSTADATVMRRQIQLDEAQGRLDETTIRAEIRGILSEVTALRGGIVGANEKLGRIIDPLALEVRFRVSAAQYARLLGDGGTLERAALSVTLRSGDVTLNATGQIDRESADVGDGQTGRQIFATLDAAPGMRPGDFVTVTLSEPPLANAARLPALALNARNEILLLGADNRLEAAVVKLLRRQGDDVLIDGSGFEGRAVVTARTPALGAGIRIKPVHDHAPPNTAIETDQASGQN